MFRKSISLLVATSFIFSLIAPVFKAQAGEMVMPVMPAPGTMVSLSSSYSPANLKGIIIHPDNALQFDFLIHRGDGNLDDHQKKQEYTKLVKYFLASLTITDKDQWVNLSPYEKDRIIDTNFGKTEMGRDLLSQDYLLKQLTSSLIYPESGLGQKFWDKVYERAYKEYGISNLPVNTFNKIWIMPDTAVIYESGNTAYILKSHLKVMLEEDYLSLQKHNGIQANVSNSTHAIGSQIVKQIILPEIEREVNEGKNFAMLRQIYSGMILATWYKKALKQSLLGQIYADKAKIKGVDQDPKSNEAIYQEYLKAFKKGVFNFIREDIDKNTRQSISRKYFAGGFLKDILNSEEQVVHKLTHDQEFTLNQAMVTVDDAMVILNQQDMNASFQADRAMFNRVIKLNELIIKLNSQKDPEVLLRLLKAIEDREDKKEAVKDLVDFILKNDQRSALYSEVSLEAIKLLRQIKEENVNTEWLKGFIFDLLKVLRENLKEQTRLMIEELLRDSGCPKEEMFVNYKRIFLANSRFVVQAAAEAMKRLGYSKEAEQFLIDTLKDETLEDYVHAQAAYGLGIVGDETSVQVLFDFLRKENLTPEGMVAAVKALYYLNENEEIRRNHEEDIYNTLWVVSEEYYVRELHADKKLLSDSNLSLVELILNEIQYRKDKNPRSNSQKIRILKKYPETKILFNFAGNDYGRRKAVEELLDDSDKRVQNNAREALDMFNNYLRQQMRYAPHNGLDLAMKTEVDKASIIPLAEPGGIDLNSSNLTMLIKRDGKGVPLSWQKQDMAQLSRLGGFRPEIIKIRPASGLPSLSEFSNAH